MFSNRDNKYFKIALYQKKNSGASLCTHSALLGIWGTVLLPYKEKYLENMTS